MLRSGVLLTLGAAALLPVLAALGSGGGTKVPVDRPTFVQGTGTGLTGIYWDNPDYTDHRISRIDPVVDFSWGAQTPDPSISAPTFSAKWVGQVQAQHNEVYTFIIEAPGGYDGTVILNEQIIIDSQYGETTIAFSTPTALVAGQWYDIEVAYRSYGGTAGIKLKWRSASDYPGGVIPQWALANSFTPSVPKNVAAYAVSSTKISLYWRAVPDVTGYNVYRATSPGAQNFLNPINGSTPVNSPSYSGSPYRVFTDSSASQGIRYYYRVKAVYGAFESSPSTETSDLPSSYAIPWDSATPDPVLAAVRSCFERVDRFEAIAHLRGVGPDGRVYEDGTTTIGAPDFQQIDGSHIVTARGEVLTFLTTDDSPPQGGQLLQPSDGPYRRVTSTRANVGVFGRLLLPERQHGHRGLHADTTYMYLGHRRRLAGDPPDACMQEVDAGLQWSQPSQTEITNYNLPPSLLNVKRGWNLYISGRNYDNSEQEVSYVGNGRFKHSGTGADEYEEDGPSYVYLAYWATTPDPLVPGHAVSLVIARTPDSLVVRGAFVPSLVGSAEPVRMKRVRAIAQGVMGLPHTGSYIRNVEWHEGALQPVGGYGSGSWAQWIQPLNAEHGSYPLNAAQVQWQNFATAFWREDILRVQTTPQ